MISNAMAANKNTDAAAKEAPPQEKPHAADTAETVKRTSENRRRTAERTDSGRAGNVRNTAKNTDVHKHTQKNTQRRNDAHRPSDRKQQAKRTSPRSADRQMPRKASRKSASPMKFGFANLKGGWSVRKKTGVTLGFIFVALVLVMATAVVMFFHYTGLLKRPDKTIKDGKPPVDARDLTDDPDTLDKEAAEKELRAMLEQKSKKISSRDVMNILLIGEDIRDTATQDRGNTDVMMLISINKKNHTVTMTSLLRDTWIYMDQFGFAAKLNAAYYKGGADYLSQVVEDYFSIDIDRTVKVNFENFIDIVETVGGLDMDVSYTEAVAMRDPTDEQNYHLGNPRETDYIDLTQYGKDEWVNYYDVDGKFCTSIVYESEEDNSIKMHLNGNQALAYARVRYGCGDDYGRTMRQRETIQEIVSEAKHLSLVELDELMNKVLPDVETDLSDGEIADLLLGAFDYMNYDIQQMRVPADGYYQFDTIDGQSCLFMYTWQFQANAAFMRYIIYGDCKNVEEAMEQYQEEINDGTFYEKNNFEPPVTW